MGKKCQKSKARLLVSEAEASVVYGVKPRTLRDWRKEADWPASRNAPFNLRLIGPWVRKHWEAEALAAPAAPGSASDAARARRLNAMAEIAEMDTAKRRGELLDRADVFATFLEVAQAVKAASEAFQTAHPAAVAEFQRLLEMHRRDLLRRYPAPITAPAPADQVPPAAPAPGGPTP